MRTQKRRNWHLGTFAPSCRQENFRRFRRRIAIFRNGAREFGRKISGKIQTGKPRHRPALPRRILRPHHKERQRLDSGASRGRIARREKPAGRPKGRDGIRRELPRISNRLQEPRKFSNEFTLKMGKRNGAEFYAGPSAPPIKAVDCGVYASGRRDGTPIYEVPIDGGYGKKSATQGCANPPNPACNKSAQRLPARVPLKPPYGGRHGFPPVLSKRRAKKANASPPAIRRKLFLLFPARKWQEEKNSAAAT